MSKQTVTNQELVDLANGLHLVKDLKGVKFALVVAKNMENLQKELKHIDTKMNDGMLFDFTINKKIEFVSP